jgi:hypothetical protein
MWQALASITFLIVLCSQPLLAQEAGRIASAGEATKNTPASSTSSDIAIPQMAVSLDRSEYFPGEAARITILISNPGPSTLKILEPFTAGTGEMSLYQNDGKGWYHTGEQGARVGTFLSALPTRLISSSEKIEQTFRSDKPRFGTDPSFAYPQVPMPFEPGRYSIGYSYASHTRPIFTIVPAIIEKIVYVPLQKPLTYGPPDKPKQIPREVSLAVLSDGKGLHYVVISCSGHHLNHDALQYPMGRMVGNAAILGPLAPYIRLGSSTASILSLDGVADAEENVTVTWSTSDGHRTTVAVSEDRESIK